MPHALLLSGRCIGSGRMPDPAALPVRRGAAAAEGINVVYTVRCPYCGRKAITHAYSVGTLKRCSECGRKYEVRGVVS